MADEQEGTAEEAQDDAFSQAFDVAEDAKDTVKEKAETAPEPEGQEEPPKEEPAVPDESAQQPGETDEKYEQRYKSLMGVHKHDKEAWEAEKATLLSKIEEVSKAVPAAPTKEEPAAEPKPEKSTYESFRESLTAAQKEELDEYERDFDIVSKMEGLKRDKALEAFEKKLQQFQEDVLSRLTPAQELFTKVADEREVQLRETHFNKIAEVHSDFEKYRDDGSIINWIETKPGYIKKGMLEAYHHGTSQEVVELISDFKKENNIETVGASRPITHDQMTQALQGKREAKRQAMQSVTGRRGAVNPTMAVANDFEGAFEEALIK
jgi:hypothetical protein